MVDDKLLPRGRDALYWALAKTMPDWTVAKITDAACTSAQEMGDISLVGLAARAKDPVALAAMRESVVLYAALFLTGPPIRQEYLYEWKVDEDLTNYARRFINAFNKLFGEQLPTPEAVNAELFWREYRANKIIGRCVRIAVDVQDGQSNHYHWAIESGNDSKNIVKDFWDTEIGTTERYCNFTGRAYLMTNPYSQLIQDRIPDQEYRVPRRRNPVVRLLDFLRRPAEQGGVQALLTPWNSLRARPIGFPRQSSI